MKKKKKHAGGEVKKKKINKKVKGANERTKKREYVESVIEFERERENECETARMRIKVTREMVRARSEHTFAY